jgi:hypothetical protein
MGYRRLGLTAVTLCLLIAVKPEPAGAASAGALAAMHADAVAAAGSTLTHFRLSAHFRKTQSYYCYPRNYWWFYRPYTTGLDGHARCMPYFHYPEVGRGARSNRSIK